MTDVISSNLILKFVCFIFSPFLTAGKREILADYALPIAVLFMSFFGSYIFRDIKCKSDCLFFFENICINDTIIYIIRA